MSSKNTFGFLALVDLIPFTFDTFGVPAPVDLRKRVQSVMHNNIVSPRLMNVVFRKTGFATQKDLAAHILFIF
jgi:hypothetical protein